MVWMARIPRPKYMNVDKEFGRAPVVSWVCTGQVNVQVFVCTLLYKDPTGLANSMQKKEVVPRTASCRIFAAGEVYAIKSR